MNSELRHSELRPVETSRLDKPRDFRHSEFEFYASNVPSQNVAFNILT